MSEANDNTKKDAVRHLAAQLVINLVAIILIWIVLVLDRKRMSEGYQIMLAVASGLSLGLVIIGIYNIYQTLKRDD